MGSIGKLAVESSYKFHSVTSLVFMALVVASIYLTGDVKQLLEEHQKMRENSLTRCDLFSGKWVFDNKSYPLYKEQSCSFMPDDLGCESHGRKDLKYQYWRWQPHECDLPRFNGTALLEKLRGKRLVFVGDSLNKNQWAPLVCLVESSISSSSLKSLHMDGNFSTFKATEYNTSIEFYWSPFLVESNCDEPARAAHRIHVNGGHFGWESFNSSDGVYKVEDRHPSYEMGLKTWFNWLDIHVNRTKTRLFFNGLQTYHAK